MRREKLFPFEKKKSVCLRLFFFLPLNFIAAVGLKGGDKARLAHTNACRSFP